MRIYHCKVCKREWEVPADLTGTPHCKVCRRFCEKGVLSTEK